MNKNIDFELQKNKNIGLIDIKIKINLFYKN